MTSYFLIFSDGTLDQTVGENTVVFDHGLTFTGRGVTEYGEARNENIIHMAEHFADTAEPVNAIIGQLWWDTNIDILKVWDGATFVPVTVDDFVLSGTYSVIDGTGVITLPKDEGGQVDIINAASKADLDAHIADATDAHLAALVDFAPVGLIPSTDVQAAIDLVQFDIDLHETGPTGVHTAANISNAPLGSISATDVQAAIDELKELDGVSPLKHIDSLFIDINDTIDDLTDHLTDTVDAHDASAISFVPGGSGLVSTEVQAAIDEISGGAGTPGALETTRARPSAAQAVGVAFTKQLFSIVEHGNDTGQYSTGTSRYTAGFDQELNIKFSAQWTLLNNTVGESEIRKNGVSIRNHQWTNYDNNSDASEVQIARQHEITVKTRLNAGQFIEFFAKNLIATTNSGDRNFTHVEFEVVRAL